MAFKSKPVLPVERKLDRAEIERRWQEMRVYTQRALQCARDLAEYGNAAPDELRAVLAELSKVPAPEPPAAAAHV